MQQLLVSWLLIGVLLLPADQVGPLQALIGVPGIFLMLWGGASADRADPRSLLVRVYFDVGNCFAFGYPDDWIRILGSRISRVHVKDFKRSVGTADGFCDLEEGEIDFPAVMSALREIAYDGWITAELFSGKTEPEPFLAKISASMDRILERA